MTDAFFTEFPHARRREAASLAAHYVAGVLDQSSVVSGVISLAEKVDFKPGDRVKTLKGSMNGTVLPVLSDGRVKWRADSGVELTSLPESLIRRKKR
ncbi:MAG TPA: hypothetical protein VMA35_02040 [Candidatus Sulfopaludibacter sp.]|nr:hypothetical protein [Candidatus Sulfopaludibacter sp.]